MWLGKCDSRGYQMAWPCPKAAAVPGWTARCVGWPCQVPRQALPLELASKACAAVRHCSREHAASGPPPPPNNGRRLVDKYHAPQTGAAG